MRRSLVIVSMAAAACGPAQPAQNAEPTAPMSIEELRAAWIPLAKEEATLTSDLTLLPTLGSEEKSRRLTRMRQSAGFISAGLGRLRPPEVLVWCHRTARDAAKLANETLDRINEVWMGRATVGRATAEQLSTDLCEALHSLAAARQACGVTESVTVPTVCGG